MNFRAAARRWFPGPTSKVTEAVDTLSFLRLTDAREFHAVHEREHLRRLLPHLRVDCVFDVGANAGQYARMLRQGARYQGRIISFEPVPALAARVRELAAYDPLWTVEELALDESARPATFNVMKGDQFSSLGTPEHQGVGTFDGQNIPAAQIQLQTETLDNVFPRLQRQFGFRRPFLKMDTQGFDVRVFRGGQAVVGNFVGLQSELAVKKIYRETVHYTEALATYEEAGFELSAFVPNNAGHFPTLVEMDCIMVRKAGA